MSTKHKASRHRYWKWDGNSKKARMPYRDGEAWWYSDRDGITVVAERADAKAFTTITRITWGQLLREFKRGTTRRRPTGAKR